MACWNISDLDGRPSWPAGVSTSVATLRRTLSLVSLGVPDRPREGRVRHEHHACGTSGREVFQRRPDMGRRKFTQRHRPDDADERLQELPLGADRLRRPPGKPIGQPVSDRLLYGVASVRHYADVQLVVQIGELDPDLGLVSARDLLAPSPTVRTGLETGTARSTLLRRH